MWMERDTSRKTSNDGKKEEGEENIPNSLAENH